MVHSKYLQPQLTGKREPKGKLDLRRKPVGIDREELIELIEAVAYLGCVGIIIVMMFGFI